MYEMTLEDKAILDPSWTFDTTDAGVKTFFRWLTFEALETVNLKPDFLRGVLKELSENTEHLVIRE